jgi:hypothetical protein
MTSELESLYTKRKVVLWVEDELTRLWLRALWQDSDFALFVAGGNEAVRAVVADARAAGRGNVFGVRDRDFSAPNRAHWLVQAKNPTVFVPDAHEVENFLLDFQGLASLDANYNPHARTADDLADRAHQRANEGLWWMAARATIADVRLLVTGDFPSHPKLGTPALASLADARQELEKCLVHSDWGVRIRAYVPCLDAAWIAERLTHHEAVLRAHLDDGSWRWTWSGKELLSHVAGYLGCAVPDLAKGLAEHQRANGTIDPVMTDLRTALRKRSGLEAW